MCGIAGLITDRGNEGAKHALQDMATLQKHRGPDDEGLQILSSGEALIGFASRRLAILDTSSAGHQPMFNPETGDWIIFNGEIYNYLELRDELKRTGCVFRTGTDTEVLLKSFEAWGTDFLDKLNGMYALALWDSGRKQVLLARDPLGMKPLYYANHAREGMFAWASEVRALTASGLVKNQPDSAAISGYLAYGSVPEPSTIIKGILALPPGTILKIDPHRRVTGPTSFWEFPPPTEMAHRRTDLVEKGRGLLQAAVDRHLRSDVPLGVFLSSGVDSTAIAGFGKRNDADLHTLTVALPMSPALNESQIARRTASRLGTTHHECEIDESTCLAWTQQGFAAMDQPALDGLNTYIVSRAAREAGLTVALSGLGGDELFGGYRSFVDVPKWRRLNSISRWIPQPLYTAGATFIGRRHGTVKGNKAHDVSRAGSDLVDLYTHFRRVLSNRELESVGLSHKYVNLPRSYVPSQAQLQHLISDDDVVTVSRLETRFYMLNTLLRDSDVFGMANSLEIRLPLLDREVVEWAASLTSAELLPRGEGSKFLLREIAGEHLYPEQLTLDKQGFVLPIAQWMRTTLREYVQDAIVSLNSSGEVDPTGVNSIVRQFEREPNTSSWSRLWCVVSLGAWLARRNSSAGLLGSPIG